MGPMQSMLSRSQNETIEFAKKFTRKLKGGESLGLVGELGSGKTTFVKGLAVGLGIKEPITSPTFVLLKEYDILRPNRHPRGVGKSVRFLVHIDAYRVEKIEDIKSVGIEDCLSRKETIVVVEWAEKIKKILPKHTIYINFKHKSEKEREILIQ